MNVITVYTKNGHIRTYELRNTEGEDKDGINTEGGMFVVVGWIHDWEESSIETDSGPVVTRRTIREQRVEAHFAPADMTFYEITI